MFTTEERREKIATFRAVPDQLGALVSDLSDTDLTTAFIEDEWTVAQIIHHLADAHLNAYMRFKFILLEDRPPLKRYNQEDWAMTADSQQANISVSMQIIRGLHGRWSDLMESLLDDNDVWARASKYPDSKDLSLDYLLNGYVNHSANHIEQIEKTLEARWVV